MLLSGSALLLAASEISAAWRYQAEAGGGWRHVEEREDGAALVEEDGVALTVRAAVERGMGAWFGGIDAGLGRAELDYDGATQAGAALTTTSTWRAGHIGATAGRDFDWPVPGRWRGRLEYQWRDRAIASTSEADGLSETYRTLWLGMGLSLTPMRSVALELGFACAVRSEVDVSFNSSLDDARLEVGNHCRVGVDTPFEIGRAGRSTVFLRPFVAWERYPQSRAERLTAGGSPVGRVYLPGTRFLTIGVSIGVGGRQVQ